MHSMEMSTTPTNETTIIVDDKMLLMDNLNVSVNNEQEDMKRFSERFPMKISSTCLMVILEGSIGFNVGFHDYLASANTCVIVTAGTIIERVNIDSDAKLIFLSFSQNNLPSVANIRQRNLSRLYALQVILLHLQPVHVQLLKTTYQTLRTILSDPEFNVNRDEAANNCINLMGSIIEQGGNNQPEVANKPSRKDDIVSRFLQCVHENYRQHRDLGFYADQLCLSLKYMSHVVYEQTGRYPTRWIKDYVILDAKTMLRSGRYTIQQIAEELHFPNQSFFGKYFKEAVGVSPKKWK